MVLLPTADKQQVPLVPPWHFFSLDPAQRSTSHSPQRHSQAQACLSLRASPPLLLQLFAPGLTPGPNGENNYPINEAWIYDPWSAAGQRFKRTGAYSRQARAYHATGLLTGRGDILITGR